MVNYIVFDLDGTLLDTLSGLTLATNDTLKELNISLHYSKDEVRTFIGNGAFKLFSRALKRKPTEDEFNLFLKKYEECQYISEPFPNVIKTLKELEILKIPLIIFSNKPDYILQKLITNNLSEVHFTYTQGQDFDYPPKPDVTLLNKVLKDLNLFGKEGLFVGDSVVDVLTANNAKIKCLIVPYGYANKEDLMRENNYISIDDFSEVKKYL